MRTNPFIKTVRQPISSMSIEKPFQNPTPQSAQDTRNEKQVIVKQQNFLWQLGVQVNLNDQTTALTFPLNKLVGQKHKWLQIDSIRFCMKDMPVTQICPSYIGIYWKNVDGFLNNHNVASHIIGIAYPDQLTISPNNLSTVVFQNNQQTMWEVTNMANLSLKIISSLEPSVPLTLPLPSPMLVSGKIIRIIDQ